MGEGVFHIGIANARQALAGRAADGDRGQALRRIAPVPGDVCSSQALQERPMRRVKVAERDKVFGQWPGLVAGPSVERGDQLRLVNQAVLEREQSEEQVARWVGSRWHLCRFPIETFQTGDEANGLRTIRTPDEPPCKTSIISEHKLVDLVDVFGASDQTDRCLSTDRSPTTRPVEPDSDRGLQSMRTGPTGL